MPVKYKSLGENLQNTKKIALLALKSSYKYFEFLPEALQEDIEVIDTAIACGLTPPEGFVPVELRNDAYGFKLIIDGMPTNTYKAVKYASPLFKNDANFAEYVITKDPLAFQYISESLRHNPDFVRRVLPQNMENPPLIFKFLSREMQQSPLDIFNLFGLSPNLFDFLPGELKTNRKFILEIIGSPGHCEKYQSFPEVFRDDPEIVRLAVARHQGNLTFATDRFKTEKNLVMNMLEITTTCYRYISTALQSDIEILKLILSLNPCGLKLIHDDLKTEELVLFAANTKLGAYPNSIPLKFRNHFKIMLPCCSKYITYLWYASPTLLSDKIFISQVILGNIKLNGNNGNIFSVPEVYKFTIAAHPSLTNDREFVKEAVRLSGFMLQYFPQYVEDPEFAIMALQQKLNLTLKYTGDPTFSYGISPSDRIIPSKTDLNPFVIQLINKGPKLNENIFDALVCADPRIARFLSDAREPQAVNAFALSILQGSLKITDLPDNFQLNAKLLFMASDGFPAGNPFTLRFTWVGAVIRMSIARTNPESAYFSPNKRQRTGRRAHI